ncbi:MAG: hypothetical protein MAG453_00574 [Calditrichaeota bacterium]|nr:hypothetical protein [Calditrichota bacterium]
MDSVLQLVTIVIGGWCVVGLALALLRARARNARWSEVTLYIADDRNA